MKHENSQTLNTVNRSNLEALKGLADIYLSGAERLTALNLASTREMFDDTITASMQQTSKKNESGFNLPQMAFVKPSFEKAIAYSRSAYEILLESQQEAIKTVSSLVTNMNGNFKVPADWTASMEMFTNGVKEASSIAKKNVATATEAAQRTVSEARAKLEKAA